MIAIAVDDEVLMLGALVAAVEASPDIASVTKFSDCESALEYAQNNPIDIAFLDINMRGMGGLALAEGSLRHVQGARSCSARDMRNMLFPHSSFTHRDI